MGKRLSFTTLRETPAAMPYLARQMADYETDNEERMEMYGKPAAEQRVFEDMQRARDSQRRHDMTLDVMQAWQRGDMDIDTAASIIRAL